MPSSLYTFRYRANNLIGSMFTSENLDDTDYDIQHLKVHFILNEGDILDLLITYMFVPTDKDEQEKD